MATTPRNYRRLEGSELQPSLRARPLGPASETETLSVTIILRRRPDSPPVPEPAHYLHTSPSERRRLSERDFSARYGAEPAEIEKVADFARGHGLTVDETHAARRTVVVSGTVAQVNQAFNVSLQNYEHEVERSRRSGRKTERYRSYDGFIHVPADLTEVIVGVFGLDNRRITKRGLADPPNTNPIPIATHRNLQCRRLQAPGFECRIQAQEPALEAGQQPVPGDAASRLVPRRRHPLHRDREATPIL